MEKLTIQTDKIYHFLACFSLTYILGNFDMLFSICVVMIVSMLKEIYDEFFGNGWSWGDIVADIFGIVIGIISLL